MKVLIGDTTGVGGTFFNTMHSLFYRARRAVFSFWDLRLSDALAFDAGLTPPLLGFCFFSVFSESFRLPFRVVTSSARETNSASLLDNDPQT